LNLRRLSSTTTRCIRRQRVRIAGAYGGIGTADIPLYYADHLHFLIPSERFLQHESCFHRSISRGYIEPVGEASHIPHFPLHISALPLIIGTASPHPALNCSGSLMSLVLQRVYFSDLRWKCGLLGLNELSLLLELSCARLSHACLTSQKVDFGLGVALESC
jgi:hypothetical protein